MKSQRDQAVSKAISIFKAKFHAPYSILTQIAMVSLKSRLTNILDTKTGGELYELGLLPLCAISNANNLDEVKNAIDTYLAATRYYERNYKALYYLVREPWFIILIKNGDIHYWDELTSRTISYKNLSREQSGVFVRDTLSHTNLGMSTLDDNGRRKLFNK